MRFAGSSAASSSSAPPPPSWSIATPPPPTATLPANQANETSYVCEADIDERAYHLCLEAECIQHDQVEKWRAKEHWVMLTGRATSKELAFDELSPSEQVKMRKAMSAEWEKWLQFHAVKFVSKSDLDNYLDKNPSSLSLRRDGS